MFGPDFLQAMADINFDQHGVNAAAEFANTSASACDMDYHLQKTMYNLSRHSDHCNGALHSLLSTLQWCTRTSKGRLTALRIQCAALWQFAGWCAASRPTLACKFDESVGAALLHEDMHSSVLEMALVTVPALLALLLLVLLGAQCALLGGSPWDDGADVEDA